MLYSGLKTAIINQEMFPSHSQIITLGLLRENIEKLHINARLINFKCHPVL